MAFSRYILESFVEREGIDSFLWSWFLLLSYEYQTLP